MTRREHLIEPRRRTGRYSLTAIVAEINWSALRTHRRIRNLISVAKTFFRPRQSINQSIVSAARYAARGRVVFIARRSAIAEGPRDALWQLK